MRQETESDFCCIDNTPFHNWSIVLLDSDDSGNEARRALKRGGARKKQVLKESLILQIGELESESLTTFREEISDIEDLIPIAICAKAIQKYLQEVYGITILINTSTLEQKVKTAKNTFAGLDEYVKSIGEKGDNENIHIEKVGFSRYVIEFVQDSIRSSNDESQQSVREIEKTSESYSVKLIKESERLKEIKVMNVSQKK